MNELEKENAELRQQLAAFHAAMEREKKPDWEKWLKDLADGIDTYTLNVEHYIATSPAWPKYREMFGHAARQLRYMADCFTLKANFVPSELRIKELEQQLAQAQARRGDGLCYYCGYPTNSLSGNPSNWPLVLCHSDEPGVPKYHHVGCVSDLLAKLGRCVTALNKIRHELKARFHDDFPLNQNLRDIAAIADDALASQKDAK